MKKNSDRTANSVKKQKGVLYATNHVRQEHTQKQKPATALPAQQSMPTANYVKEEHNAHNATRGTILKTTAAKYVREGTNALTASIEHNVI